MRLLVLSVLDVEAALETIALSQKWSLYLNNSKASNICDVRQLCSSDKICLASLHKRSTEATEPYMRKQSMYSAFSSERLDWTLRYLSLSFILGEAHDMPFFRIFDLLFRRDESEISSLLLSSDSILLWIFTTADSKITSFPKGWLNSNVVGTDLTLKVWGPLLRFEFWNSLKK